MWVDNYTNLMLKNDDVLKMRQPRNVVKVIKSHTYVFMLILSISITTAYAQMYVHSRNRMFCTKRGINIG